MVRVSCILEWTLWGRKYFFLLYFLYNLGWGGNWVNNRKIVFAHKKMFLEPSVVLCPLRKQERECLPLLLPITAVAAGGESSAQDKR